MDYQEFISKIKKEKIQINQFGCRPIDNLPDDIKEKLCHWKKEGRVKTFAQKSDFIGNLRLTGGLTGGSCWDYSEPREFSDNSEQFTYEELDGVLKIFSPNITFLVYKELINRLVKRDNAIDYQYYGNRDDYEYWYIDLKELFEYLIENKL